MNIKTIGSEADCDLVLNNGSVSALHARLELNSDGHVFVLDSGSDQDTWLNRNEQWIRIHKVRLCIADRIRFGELEVPLAQLIALFGKGANVRLGDKHFSLRKRNSQVANEVDKPGDATLLDRPKRNPLTGKVEQQAIKPAAQQD